jgi:WD40 repeat protein
VGENFGTWLAISADGKRLAVSNCSRGRRTVVLGGAETLRFAILSVPDLNRISVCTVRGERDLSLWSFTLSPDGKVLAVAVGSHPRPHLFRTDTGEPILPTKGHIGPLSSVHFLDAGRTIRSVGEDGVDCLWDARTMRLRSRLIPPKPVRVVGVREPDGAYLLVQRTTGDDRPLEVLDAATGQVVCSPSLGGSVSSRYAEVHWLNAREALLCTDKRLIEFDYHTGKVLRKRAPPWTNQPRRTLVAGGTLYWLRFAYHSPYVDVQALDLSTGKWRKVGEASVGHRGDDTKCGLLPGGRYIHTGPPGLRLLDRRNARIVIDRPEDGKVELRDVAFTGDGGWYAVVAHGDFWAAEPQTFVRIHDTRSGKTLGAFPAPNGVKVRFSPDGRRLAVINEEDTLEVWDLSGLAKP